MSTPDIPPGVVGDRPSRPDPELLRRGHDEVSHRLGHEPGPWQLVGRCTRPRSTLFVLRCRHAEGVIDAVAKIDYLQSAEEDAPRHETLRRVQRRRRELTRERELAPQLIDIVQARHLTLKIDEPLAIAPDRLSALRLMVPGKNLDRLAKVIARAGIRQAIDAFHVLGQFISLMEGVGERGDHPDQRVRRSQFERLDRSVQRLRSVGTFPDPDGLRQRAMVLLHRELSKSDSVVLTHGDLSPSNILLRKNSLGVIDFGWTHRIRGHDLAHLLARVEVERPQLPGLAASARRALLDGYGQRHADDRSLELAYLDRASSAAVKLGGARGRRARWRLHRVCEAIMDDRPFLR